MLDLAGLPSTLAIPGISIAFIVMSFIIGEIINRVHGLGGYEIPSENPDEELHPIGDDMQTSNLSNYVKSEMFWPSFFGVFGIIVSFLAAILIGFVTSTPA
jgi:hypothetical protein